MKAVAIIHFNPLDNYPPAINFINYFNKHETDSVLYVFTTSNGQRSRSFEESYSTGKLKIEYLKPINLEIAFLQRAFRSSWFYLYVLTRLVRIKPSSILYYETMSSWPVLIYKRRFRKKARILAHYHEYNTVEEHRKASILNRWSWKFEKRNFQLVDTVSHTNEMRLELFKKDHAPFVFANTMILPNYPPRSWIVENLKKKRGTSDPLKLIYVGYGLSKETMYVEEVFSWVKKQGGNITLDCFIQFLDPVTKEFNEKLDCPWIRIKPSVSYFELPSLFSNYDTGVILYKGHLLNFIYNAPNKLFEYLACGLNVWFPVVMTGSLEYVKTDSLPKVIAIDFNDLDNFKWREASDSKGLEYKASPYYCEKVYGKLLSKLVGA